MGEAAHRELVPLDGDRQVGDMPSFLHVQQCLQPAHADDCCLYCAVRARQMLRNALPKRLLLLMMIMDAIHPMHLVMVIYIPEAVHLVLCGRPALVTAHIGIHLHQRV